MPTSNLKTNANANAEPNVDVSVDEMVAQVVSFAREARQDNAAAEVRVFPNFNRILQVSSRFLMVSDLVALIAAFTCGGLIAWAADIYVFKAGFQDLLDI